ncbi:MAG: ferritin-like domain-containing protein [Burkholderiales bacterium]
MTARHAFASLRDFYAHALAIEREAAHRYQDLAQQMEMHNNLAVAETFERLARMEADHAEHIARAAPDVDTSTIPAWEYRWEGIESPESTPLDAAHYLMTPFHALELALRNEERAVNFFETVARSTPNHEVRALAATFAADERLHVEHVKAALARSDRPSLGFDHDLDPPREVD